MRLKKEKLYFICDNLYKLQYESWLKNTNLSVNLKSRHAFWFV